MLKVIKRSIPVVAILTVVILGALCDYASAAQQKSEFIVRIGNSLSIIVPRQDVKIMLDPNQKEVVTDGINVTVRTNNKNGAKVYVSTNKTAGKYTDSYNNSYSQYANSSTSLVGRETGMTIPTLKSDIDRTHFPEGYWGVSADGGNNFKGVADKDGGTEIYSVEGLGEADVREVLFGAMASDALLSDYYDNTVIFTAVATYSPKTIKDIIYMQDIDAEVADSMVTNGQYQLRDSRDNKKYWVSKLSDGNIWMTQNLGLTLSTNTTLTPADTNIPADWTPESSTIELRQVAVDQWLNDGTVPYSYGSLSGNNETTAYGYIEYPDNTSLVNSQYAFPYGTYKDKSECVAATADEEYCEHYNVGTYYNWAAAIAMNETTSLAEEGETKTINQSICPAGWRLPIGYSNEEQKGEMSILLEKEGLATTTLSDSGKTTGTYLVNSSDFMYSPLFLVNAGVKDSNNQKIEHDYGSYWTSTIHNAQNVDRFTFRTRGNDSTYDVLETNYYPDNLGNVYTDLGVGRSIRCVAKPLYTHTLRYVTPNWSYDGQSYSDLLGTTVVENSTATYPMQVNPAAALTIDPSDYIYRENMYMNGEWETYCDNNNTWHKISIGTYINVGDSCPIEAQFTEGRRVDFYGNGGTFTNGTENRAILLSNTFTTLSDYSGTDYWDGRDTIIVFEGSSYVDLEIDYNLLNTNSYASTHASNLCIMTSATTTSCYRNLTGTGHTTIRLNTSVIKLHFYSYGWSESNHVGYTINFTPQNGYIQRLYTGRIETPVREGYTFLGWSSDPYAVTPEFENFAIDGNRLYQDNEKFYAVWDDGRRARTIVYNINGGDAGTMSNQATSEYARVDLHASNFSRAGYGFAGWSEDPSAQPGGSSAIYGPNETITVPGYSGNDSDMNLYAVWVASSGDMQEFNCRTMNIGDVVARTDTRNNQTYAISRLVDGNCWMIENLRLGYEGSNDLARSQGFGAGYIGLEKYGESSLYSDDQYTGYIPRYNDANTQDRADNTTTDQNIYSYGNYYSPHAAIASYGELNVADTNIYSISICPLGWRLPGGGNSPTANNFSILDVALGGTGADRSLSRYDTSSLTTAWRAYPNNFVRSGYYNTDGNQPKNRGDTAHFATAYKGGSAIIGDRNIDFYYGANNSYGYAIRCFISY